MAVVFVTGGTGFIGKVAVRELLSRGHTVRALARSPRSRSALMSLGAEPVSGDLLAPGPWQGAARDAEWVVHLAQPPTFGARVTAKRADAYREDRLNMDRHLLDPLDPRRSKRIVYISGTSYYGDLGESLRDEDATPVPRGFGPYVVPALRALEGFLARGLPIVTAFPGYVYGDGSWFRGYVMRPLREERSINAPGGRSRFGSPIHVRDCARAVVHLLEKGEPGRRYFAVDNKPVRWDAVYETAARAMGRPLHIRRIPPLLLRLLVGPVVAESVLSDAVLSNARLRALGFELEFPTIEQGIPDIIASARP